MSGGDRGPKVALKRILVQDFPKKKQGEREVHPCFSEAIVGAAAKENRKTFDAACKTKGDWRDLAIAVHIWARDTDHANSRGVFPHPDTEEWKTQYGQRLADMVAHLASTADRADQRRRDAHDEAMRQQGHAEAAGLQSSDAESADEQERAPDGAGPSSAQERAPDGDGPSSAAAPVPATLAPAAGALAPPPPPVTAAAHQLAVCEEAIQCYERGSTLLEQLDFTQSERVHYPPWLQVAGSPYQHAVQFFGVQTFDVEFQINALRSETNARLISLRQHRQALRREQDGAPAADARERDRLSDDRPPDPVRRRSSRDNPSGHAEFRSLSAVDPPRPDHEFRSLSAVDLPLPDGLADAPHLELQEVATAKEWRALQGAYLDALRSAFSQPLPDGLADAPRAELQTLTLTADSPPPQPTDAVDVLVFVCSPTVEPLAKAPAEAFAVADAAERAGKLAYIQHGGDGSMLRQRLDQLTPRMLLFVGHADATQRNGACIVLAKSRIRY